MEAVKVERLKKVYSGGTVALKGISFEVKEGEVFSLLGPNGAGKTTTVRILATVLLPSEGEAYVFGEDVIRSPERVRPRIGYVPQEGIPYEYVTPYEMVYNFALLHGCSREEAKRNTRHALEIMGLEEVQDKVIFKLSGGNKRRVLVALALATDADLLLLDEPTIGLDPLARKKLLENLEEVKREGKTIILTTHNMEEAEFLADRVAIIHRGEILVRGAPGEIVERFGGKIRVELGRRGKEVLKEMGIEYSEREEAVIAYVDKETAIEIAKRALSRGIRVSIREPNLEDAFLNLVGGEKVEENSPRCCRCDEALPHLVEEDAPFGCDLLDNPTSNSGLLLALSARIQ